MAMNDELFNYSIIQNFEYYCKFCNQEQFKSFLRTLLSFETKFNILFVKINILILNNSFIIHELVNLAVNTHHISVRDDLWKYSD